MYLAKYLLYVNTYIFTYVSITYVFKGKYLAYVPFVCTVKASHLNYI